MHHVSISNLHYHIIQPFLAHLTIKEFDIDVLLNIENYPMQTCYTILTNAFLVTTTFHEE